jgi:hypothetical protein
MTSDLTTRKVSQRLMEVGFSADTIYNWVLVKDVNGVEDYELKEWYNSDSSPAYSASTLFEYLQAWVKASKERFMEIQEDGMVASDWDVEGANPWFKYETSLADMLAEAIIWILTQEKENK